jgi:hypothetical protein
LRRDVVISSAKVSKIFDLKDKKTKKNIKTYLFSDILKRKQRKPLTVLHAL